MIDFPASPANGQIFNPGTGIIYMWDGTAWNLVTSQTKTADRRNRIVNPAMQISQENGTTSMGTNGAYPADQWRYDFVGPAASSSALTLDPLGNFIRMWSAAVLSSPAAGNYAIFLQPMEGAVTSDFLWGTASAVPVVLRFKARTAGSLTSTVFSAAIRNATGSRSFVRNFTAQAQWQEFAMAVPGVTTGSWAADNTVGLTIAFTGMCGSTLTAPAQGSWQNGNYLAAPGIGNIFTATSQGIDVANVGLYRDPLGTGIPPDFEVPDYPSELWRCRRYWEQAAITSCVLGGGDYTNTSFYKASKRVNPILTAASGVNGATFQALGYGPTEGFRQIGTASAAIDSAINANARM